MKVTPADWMAQDSFVACPDLDERLIMRIERIGVVELETHDLT